MSRSQEDGGDETTPRVDRRSYLKLVGLTAAPAVATTATDSARAETGSGGFGAGAYGSGSYDGSSTDDSPSVATGSATDVTASSATLTGDVADLGGASSVDAAFDLRPTETTSWTTSDSQTLTEPGNFGVTVDDLDGDTTYEYRAVADASDGDTATGSVETVTTEAAAQPPAIDQFDVSESGSPNPHAEIDVSWRVSDPDADLEAVEIVLVDDGSEVRNTTTSVSGGEASGSESFTIKHGEGATYDCTLTVTDARSQSVSRTESVSA